MLHLGGHNGAAARRSIPSSTVLLPHTPHVLHAVGVAGLHAHLFLCPQGRKSYSKANLWAICGVDILIATLYQIDIMWYESLDEYTNYMLTEIWIRPTITYGLVACFVTEAKES